MLKSMVSCDNLIPDNSSYCMSQSKLGISLFLITPVYAQVNGILGYNLITDNSSIYAQVNGILGYNLITDNSSIYAQVNGI